MEALRIYVQDEIRIGGEEFRGLYSFCHTDCVSTYSIDTLNKEISWAPSFARAPSYIILNIQNSTMGVYSA
jgi:hypothetical protein